MPVCLLNLHKNGTHIPQECWRWSTWCKTNGWSEHAGELGDSLPGKTCVRGNPCLLESCKRIQITSLWLIIAYYWPSLQRLNLHIYTRGLALMLWVIYLLHIISVYIMMVKHFIFQIYLILMYIMLLDYHSNHKKPILQIGIQWKLKVQLLKMFHNNN